jgi:acetyl esterase/lipase
MSRRAELLLLCLRYLKKRHAHQATPLPEVRRRLKLIERIVPLPPAGTRTQVIDADGIGAVHITVPQSRTDRYLLYFHGGGYVVGSAPLYRDFLWRIAVAARASVLYFDYRLPSGGRSRINRWDLARSSAFALSNTGRAGRLTPASCSHAAPNRPHVRTDHPAACADHPGAKRTHGRIV